MCGKKGHLAKNCWFAEKPAGSVSVNQSVNHGTGNQWNNNNNNRNNASAGGRPRVPARVFAMSGEETVASEGLIRGKCFCQNKLLDVLYDSGATHSFISHACVEKIRVKCVGNTL